MGTTTRITVTLGRGQAQDLTRIAEENQISVSALVRYAVNRLLSDRVISLAAAHTIRMDEPVKESAKAGAR